MTNEAPSSALVIGYGSAGKRHARELQALGLKVAVVSRRPLEGVLAYDALGPALEAERPDYLVIANETAQHGATLAALVALDYSGRVLVEKPLTRDPEALPEHRFAALYVGYQLRFHPVIQRLRAALSELRPVAVQAYVGQHLATWRPERDYRDSYSSQAEAGGGALRDLSHEIDLLLWLLGGWTRIAALGGNHGVLETNAEDAFAILMETSNCPLVTLQLNCLDRQTRREILVVGDRHTLHADLIAGTLRISDREERFAVASDEPTMAMHRAALAGDTATLCSAGQAEAVMGAVEAAERAASRSTWVWA